MLPCRLLRHPRVRLVQPSPLRTLLGAPVTITIGQSAKARALSTLPPGHDDQVLGKIFDCEPFWLEFSQSSKQYLLRPRSGLFQNHYLTNPSGFREFTQATLQKCKRLTAKVVAASSLEEYKSIPRALDQLSDALCRVLDIAEFVRTNHPDTSFQTAANNAYVELFQYMNVLNTTTEINSQLKKASANFEISNSWDQEEKAVARTLLKEFSKSAIDLPRSQRERFVTLSTEINRIGTVFLRDMTVARSFTAFNKEQLNGMDPLILKQLTNKQGKVVLPTTGPFSTIALRTVKDEYARRQIYIAGRMSSANQVNVLERLLLLRAELAKLSGYDSYAEMSLSDKMALSPEAVKTFLERLTMANACQIQQELNEMLMMKQRLNPIDRPTTISPWDREFYRASIVAQTRTKSRKPDFMLAYFSLGRVMQGLSRLFSKLYGVRFRPSKTVPGEVWDPEVRRLDVIDEIEGHIAVVYCDLFARPGKNANPSHFTLRCSRQISPAEIQEAANSLTDLDPSDAANDGMATLKTKEGKVYQLPIIALICDFDPPKPNSTRPSLLSFRDVQTIFHEMGHAIHSILGRTNLQTVAGTRCATDFVELPSVLMEHFAQDPSVLALFATHWETNAPLPYEIVAERLALDRKGQGTETETQILLAMLDQSYHSDIPLTARQDGGGFNSTAILHEVYDRYGSVREPHETTAQGFFGHLVEYGGTYYSYLFDRAIARKVWKEVFGAGKNGGAVSREAGQRMRDEVLKWGGARDGWSCVAGVLNDDSLRNGGPGAMAEVGKWGVKD